MVRKKYISNQFEETKLGITPEYDAPYSFIVRIRIKIRVRVRD